MSKFTIPKRGNITHQPTEFIANTTQIKPYFECFEDQYDGLQSPASIALNVLYTTSHGEANVFQCPMLRTTIYTQINATNY